ncbi:hypothetical protein, conserved [Plasmodium gonderi]|uniref:Photosensitized INA-labeled protein PHIL1 n=1 Tax=Plasmodium gonderi TaxID=77519 RepID=A0A1Y1J999_PLAGO|nr:hypothetical protein, conserved [Plasmodium gonderi]GAW79089.1 hypothetical protein, conserved [Plasmodium gonderi]
MLSSSIPKRYIFEKKGNATEANFLGCKSIIFAQNYVASKKHFSCTTRVVPDLHETAYDSKILKMAMSQDNIFEVDAMNANAYTHGSPSLHNISMMNNVNCDNGMNGMIGMNSMSGGLDANQYTANPCNNMMTISINGQELKNNPLIFVDGDQYTPDTPVQGIDPGVVAVSNALFAYNSAFQCIPIKTSPNVFRRRTRGEANSEWSNAFVTRIDPCECGEPNEEFKPYEVTKYYDEGKVKTVFNFDQDSSSPQE